MRSFLTITTNAFLELVRQPIYLILLVASIAFMMILSSIYYFGLGEDTNGSPSQVARFRILAEPFLMKSVTSCRIQALFQKLFVS
tara:strand:+ start:197 stop:451 length:255 start_codon:yes stop_codon:yes gene_type:complete